MSEIAVFNVKDHEVIVDKKYYEDFWSKGRWTISHQYLNRPKQQGYLYGSVIINNRRYRDYGHRLLMYYLGVNIPEKRQVHHINKNRLDNRECNLEIVSNMENCQTKNKTIIPKYKPAWDKSYKIWRIKIRIYKKVYQFASVDRQTCIQKRNVFLKNNNLSIPEDSDEEPEEEPKQKYNIITFKSK